MFSANFAKSLPQSYELSSGIVDLAKNVSSQVKTTTNHALASTKNASSQVYHTAKAAGAKVYGAAEQYNRVVEKTVATAEMIKDMGVGIGQFGKAFLNVGWNTATHPLQTAKNVIYISSGANNMQEGIQAFQKKAPFKHTNKDGIEIVVTDVRTLPERAGEAGGHIGAGLYKLAGVATYYPALMLGMVSNAADAIGLPLPTTNNAGFEAIHLASKTTATVTSYLTSTAASATWTGMEMVGSGFMTSLSLAKDLTLSAAANPDVTAKVMNFGVTGLATAGSLYMATSNFTECVDAKTVGDKVKHGMLSMVGAVGTVAIPAMLGSGETRSAFAALALVGSGTMFLANNYQAMKNKWMALRG